MEARTRDYASIGWAVNHLRLGHQMRRKSWPADLYVSYDNAAAGPSAPLSLYTSDGPIEWTPVQADLVIADWEMVNPVLPGEYHAD